MCQCPNPPAPGLPGEAGGAIDGRLFTSQDNGTRWSEIPKERRLPPFTQVAHCLPHGDGLSGWDGEPLTLKPYRYCLPLDVNGASKHNRLLR